MYQWYTTAQKKNYLFKISSFEKKIWAMNIVQNVRKFFHENEKKLNFKYNMIGQFSNRVIQTHISFSISFRFRFKNNFHIIFVDHFLLDKKKSNDSIQII